MTPTELLRGFPVGYSGLFHTIATFPDETTRERARSEVPYLVGNTGWMVLEVNAEGDGVLVRRDSAAICDLIFMPRREAPDESRSSNVRSLIANPVERPQRG